MLPVVVGGKLSYIDGSGRVVLDTEFNRGSRFRSGHAVVYRGRAAGLMDAAGNVAINCAYDALKFVDDDLLAFRQGGRWGFAISPGM